MHRPIPKTVRFTPQEAAAFLRIATESAKIKRHYDLYVLFQNTIQPLIPHQIMISAWGDFHASNPLFDVISTLPRVRTGILAGCGCSVDHLLKNFFQRWVAGGRRPLLLDNAAIAPTLHAACACPKPCALPSMQSALVHGIRNKRDNIENLYVMMSSESITTGRSAERLCFLVDPLVTQFDAAFRKVAAWKPAETSAEHVALPRTDPLSEREQEIVRWISAGKTNTEIARILDLSVFTVKNHVHRIFGKLGATNRTEAATFCRHGNGSDRGSATPHARRPSRPDAGTDCPREISGFSPDQS